MRVFSKSSVDDIYNGEFIGQVLSSQLVENVDYNLVRKIPILLLYTVTNLQS